MSLGLFMNDLRKVKIINQKVVWTKNVDSKLLATIFLVIFKQNDWNYWLLIDDVKRVRGLEHSLFKSMSSKQGYTSKNCGGIIWWRVLPEFQNHGGLFRPNDGKWWKTTLIFACFLWFWKTRKLAFIDESKKFFCLVANVGLTDFSRFFFGDSQG